MRKLLIVMAAVGMSALLAANALAQDQPKEKTEPKEKTNVEEKGSCRDAIELPKGADQKAVRSQPA